MSTPRVSVVIPTRDRSFLLEATLRSVLLQTSPVSQILIVDDGSRDPESVSRLAALSSKVEIVRHSASLGVSAARNSGIEKLDADFVLFLDDDDLIHPRFVEDGLLALDRHPETDVVVFLSECIFTPESLGATFPIALLFDYERLPSQPLRFVDNSNPVSRPDLESRPVTAFVRYTIPIHSCFLRTAALEGHRFPESLCQGEDTYFWVSLAAAGRRFHLDERVYAFVRRHPANTTRSRARYRLEIQACYQRLLDERLLTEPGDVYLAHLKLLSFKLSLGAPGWLRHAMHLASRPLRMADEIRFWARNLYGRRRVLRYYFS